MNMINISCDPLNPAATPADWAQIKPQVLAYLQQAPAIMVARTKHPDALDPSKTFAVPVSVRTDGTFTWPTAVNYYAEHHDIAPDTALLDHIRALGFQAPTITDQMQQEAINSLQRR